MAIDSIYNVSAYSAYTNNRSKVGTDNLDTSDFLRLMAAQLQNQSMYDQTDNSQFLAQLAQFSTLTQMTELASAVKANTAMSLLGKEVAVPDGANGVIIGVVSSVGIQDGTPYLRVNDTYYSLSDILEVSTPEAASGWINPTV